MKVKPLSVKVCKHSLKVIPVKLPIKNAVQTFMTDEFMCVPRSIYDACIACLGRYKSVVQRDL